MSTPYNLIAVIGPTAGGKTAFAAHLAGHLHGEVISADSRQVYRHMNIGTGKDYGDYLVDGKMIPVHLIDIAEPGYKYSVFEYQRDFFKVLNDMSNRKSFPVLCGGSGMYINAATKNYRLDEVPRNDNLRKELENKNLEELTLILHSLKKLHNRSDTDTREHAMRAIEIGKYNQENGPGRNYPELNTLYLGVKFDRQKERERITERLTARLKDGMIDEVKQLLDSGIEPESLTWYGLEYRYITLFLLGKIDYESMKSGLNTAIHQFAKRQMTWFRKMEREGCLIHWIDGNLPLPEKLETALRLLNERTK